MFLRTPTGFLPDEDQGVLFSMASLPPGSPRAQSLNVLERIEQHFMVAEKDNVRGTFGVLGFSFSGSGQNQVLAFVNLKDWDERKSPGQTVKAIQGRAMGAFMQFKNAFAFAFAPPAVLELGTATGFDVRLVDRAGLGHAALTGARNQLLGLAAQNPALTRVHPNGLDDMPEYHLEVDQEKASALGLSLAGINSSLSTIWGSTYINDFIDKRRVKKVFMQGDAPFRMAPEDVNRWSVRNVQNGMVPFSAFSTAKWQLGSPKLERFNGAPRWPFSASPPKAAAPARRWSRSRKSPNSCPPASASSGPGFPTKNGSPARNPPRSTPSHCSWFSFALRRFMKAGRSPSP